MHEAGSRSGMTRVGACGLSLTIALIVAGVPSRVMCAENQLQQAHAAAGRVWYEKYCTSCHGQGGGPGSAVYRGSDRPVDLRTYVKRNNRIRTDQEGTSGQGAVARGIVASIADYIISVQTK